MVIEWNWNRIDWFLDIISCGQGEIPLRNWDFKLRFQSHLQPKRNVWVLFEMYFSATPTAKISDTISTCKVYSNIDNRLPKMEMFGEKPLILFIFSWFLLGLCFDDFENKNTSVFLVQNKLFLVTWDVWNSEPLLP